MTLLRYPVTRRGRGRRHRWVALFLVAFLLGLQTLLGTPAAAAGPFSDCKDAPPIEVVGAGMVGSLDPPQGNGPSGSLYLDYSYAGFVWHTYDTPSQWPCVDPFATITTWIGNRLFDGGKLIVGAVNGLHYALKTGLLGGIDDIVRKGVPVLYNGAAVPYIAFALVLVAVAIFLHTLKGNLTNTAKALTRVLIGLAVMSATYLTPLLYTTLLDGLLVSGTDELERNLFQQAGPDLGGNDVIYRDVLPDLLHRTIVVDNWMIGEFGAADTDYARQTARRLLDAQACSWIEVREGSCPNHVHQKQENFKKIAQEIRGGAADYSTFQGTNSARLGAGFFALVEGLCFGVFQLVCKIGILLGQLVLRGTVLGGPVLGLLAFAPGVARTAFRAIAGVIVQALILSAAATVHTLVMVWILDSTPSGARMDKLTLMAIITMLAWVLIKPMRRLRNMIAGAVGRPPITHDQWRLERLLRRRHRRHAWQFVHRELDKLRAFITEPVKFDLGSPRPARRSHQHAPPPRPETTPEATSPPVHTHARRMYTPDPYRRADLEAAAPAASGRRPPRPGPPPRPPSPGPSPRPSGSDGTRRRSDSHDPTRGQPSTPRPGASGPSGGGRAETRPIPAATDLATRVQSRSTVVDTDLVVPSDLDQRDRAQRSENQADPPVTEPETSQDQTVYRIYRPSTQRTEPDTPTPDDAAPTDQTPPPRPEASDPTGWRSIPPWTVDPPDPHP